jgi:hypothetical protein
MDHLIQWMREIPPVSGCWTLSIVVSALLVSLGVCLPLQFSFQVSRLRTQPWALVTPFCYYGRLLFDLVISAWFLLRTARYVEDSYTTPRALMPLRGLWAGAGAGAGGRASAHVRYRLTAHQETLLAAHLERNRTVDFLYRVCLICALIVAVATMGWYYRWFNMWNLAPVLSDVLLYTHCRSNPDQVTHFLGMVPIRNLHLPWIYTMVSVMLLPDFHRDVMTIMHVLGSVWGRAAFLGTLLSQRYYLWKALVCITLAHLWWFFGDFLPTELYYDRNAARRKAQAQRDSPLRPNALLLAVKAVLLPPWYWRTMERVSHQTE